MGKRETFPVLILWRRGEDDFSRALPFFGPGLEDLVLIRAEDLISVPTKRVKGVKTPFRGYPKA